MSTEEQSTPRSYSGITAETICQQVRSHFALPAATQCQQLASGMHENFRVECPNQYFFLRVYRPRARSIADIRYEVALLEHLHRAGCPVAAAVAAGRDDRIMQIETPAGTHPAVLFSFAGGTAPGDRLDPTQSAALGCAVAKIHEAADRFQAPFARQTLDLAYLLDDSVVAIDPWLTPTQHQQLQVIQQHLHRVLPPLPHTTPWFGPCHGDINASNVHIDIDGSLTVFDFDQCGPGWRAFEIGKFFSSLPHHEQSAAIKKAFLLGYESLRPLHADERRAIAPFTAIAHLWVMALHVYHSEITGDLLTQPEFWTRKMNRLQKLAEAATSVQ